MTKYESCSTLYYSCSHHHRRWNSVSQNDRVLPCTKASAPIHDAGRAIYEFNINAKIGPIPPPYAINLEEFEADVDYDSDTFLMAHRRAENMYVQF